MDHGRFDTISKLFAQRRLSRRKAMQEGAAGVAAVALTAAGLKTAAAQDATPVVDATPSADATPVPGTTEKVPYLFIQAFQGGSLVPKEGEAGRFSLTLEQGLGQTIYFSDRPLRDVGATPTAEFLANLGFPQDNPPNAALVVEGDDGATNVAVVALYNPSYDQATRTATYDVEPLADFSRMADGGFTEAPDDLSSVPASFGGAHLFIDDCADDAIVCRPRGGMFGGTVVGWFPTQGYCWNYAMCVPCHPYGHANPYEGAAWDWWTRECNHTFAECQDDCDANSR
jgi:hypothetical protein